MNQDNPYRDVASGARKLVIPVGLGVMGTTALKVGTNTTGVKRDFGGTQLDNAEIDWEAIRNNEIYQKYINEINELKHNPYKDYIKPADYLEVSPYDDIIWRGY